MEMLALFMFYITLIGIVVSIVMIIYSIIKKDYKYKPKKIAMILIGFVIAFIVSTIFYGIVQSPESKARYEASQKENIEEKKQKELIKTEEKFEDPNKQDKQKDQSVEEAANKQSELETKNEMTVTVESKVDDRFSIKSDPNTSAAVDELYYKAKKDSSNATEDNFKEAIKFISDNYNNYWTDNEKMHKTMYYGYLLECAKKDKAKENQKGIDYAIYSLGQDSVQVVKYVYRNTEKIDSDSTQSNLKQIKKSLDKISDDYKK